MSNSSISRLKTKLNFVKNNVMDFLRSTAAKAVAYRLSASLVAQLVSLILFQSIEVNAGVFLADGIQMAWYYIFEKLWQKDI